LSLTRSSFLALLVACKPCHCRWHVAVVFLMGGKHDVLTTSRRSSSGGGSSCCFCCRSLRHNSWLWWDWYLVASSAFLQFSTIVGDPWFAAASVASVAAMGSGSVSSSSSVVFIGGEQSFSRVLIGLLLLLVLLLRPFTVCFPSLFPLFFLPLQWMRWMNEWMHAWWWPYVGRYLYWCKSARRRWWWWWWWWS
jgi:hypothetical protein